MFINLLYISSFLFIICKFGFAHYLDLICMYWTFLGQRYIALEGSASLCLNNSSQLVILVFKKILNKWYEVLNIVPHLGTNTFFDENTHFIRRALESLDSLFCFVLCFYK